MKRHEVIHCAGICRPTTLARSKSGTEVRGRTETSGGYTQRIHVRVIGDPLVVGELT